MTTPTRILVPTDFSEPARHALRYASMLAQKTGARLTVLYADRFAPPIDFTATAGAWDLVTPALLQERARHDAVDEINNCVAPGVEAKAVIRVTDASEGIIEEARDHDLIVMGTHGRTGLPRLMFGSVTEAVMRRATIPVLAISPIATGQTSIETIVCAIEFTAAWQRAMRLAASLASPHARFFVAGSHSVRSMERWIPSELAARTQPLLFAEKNFAQSLAQFATDIGADLMVAAEPRARNVIEVLRGTPAERLMQWTHCPTLTVNDRVSAPDIKEASATVAAQ